MRNVLILCMILILRSTYGSDLEEFLNSQDADVSHPIHRSVLLKNANHQEFGQSKKAFFFIQGYSLSPFFYRNLYPKMSEVGYDVISLRLKGHFEEDLYALDSVEYQSWIKQVEKIYPYLKKYEEVVFAGHSTGGLLVVHMINKFNPANLSGLMLAAPALRLANGLNVGLGVDFLFGRSLGGIISDPDGYLQKYHSGKAGVQVKKLSENLLPAKPCDRIDIYSKIEVPVLTISSSVLGDESDFVVDNNEIDLLFNSVSFSNKHQIKLSLVEDLYVHDTFGYTETKQALELYQSVANFFNGGYQSFEAPIYDKNSLGCTSKRKVYLQSGREVKMGQSDKKD